MAHGEADTPQTTISVQLKTILQPVYYTPTLLQPAFTSGN
jgi:hypothetical protein